MGLDDSIILGRLVDLEDGDETQEEINAESLFFYNQRELLDKLQDKDVSKYEIFFLLDELVNAGRIFWTTAFKELIKVFSLNTLKTFLEYEISLDRAEEVKKMIKYLKGTLPDALIDNPLPIDREGIIKYLTKTKSPHMLIHALETMDSDSVDRFKKYFI